ncbi:MAG TPA: sigma-54 dependent transcriptional regulator [Polyangiaceae bacterium]|nr:sigma-54 dependent transcriptional regulator [Polyangiaceae bacterium]
MSGEPTSRPSGSRGRILVVDDEANARSALAEILREEGYSVETASDGFKALAKAEEFDPDLVLTDLKMPGMDGVELLRRLLRAPESRVAVVVMTAFGAVETAVSAMREGAVDYLTKPLNTDELLLVLDRALENIRLRREASMLRSQLRERYRFENIIGASAEMQQVFKSVAQVAQSRATVLISGESGTGKELVAAALHHRSPRATGPFVRLHCAALAETLLESELFGHERGAFTGADRRREGRFEQANGGTLFLDEIGDISPSTQVKLLRALQEKEFERVGSNQTLHVDVRVVTATNRDLKEMVAAGKFREDLYYRLNVINIQIPPLRRRPSDIPALVEHFLKRYAAENQKPVTRVSDAALALLVGYSWPGNVRELENVIERAVVLTEGESIEPYHLPGELAATGRGSSVPIVPGATMEELERHAILKTLESVGGSTSKAAEILGISVRKIQYKLQEYGAAPKSQTPAVQQERPSSDD